MEMTPEERTKQLATFIRAQYEVWRSKHIRQGASLREVSMQKFFAWVGMPSNTFAHWELGRVPSEKHLHPLAARLGPEVYDIMGVPRHMPEDPVLYKIAEKWHKLNEQQKTEILSIIEGWTSENKAPNN